MNIKSIFLMSLFATSLQSQSVVSSEIKEVNVYLQGAQVRRQIELKLNQGLQEISIKGLAQFIDPNSIRVIGSPDFIIQGVRHELNFIQAAEEKTLELKKKRDGLLDDAAKLNQQLSILKFEKTSLEKNQVQIMGVP
ncbi:MAG: DUF4140 domain-containing protein, partial [Saprospiraceae bacterium]